MAIKNWQDGSDNWNTLGDWSPTGVPGAGDDVTIAEGNPQVTADDGTVNSVTVTSSGTLSLDNGGKLATAAAFANSGTTNVGNANDTAGNTLSVGGTLTNGGNLNVGVFFQPGSNEVDAAALVNTGTINLNGNATAGTTDQSTLKIAGAAGFGTDGIVTGTVNLSGDALVEFASGGITSIASGAQLALNGAQSRVSIGDGTTNNALTGLTSNAGSFDLAGGGTVTTAAGTDFDNTGNTNVGNANDGGGNIFSVGGTLTNADNLNIGTFFQSGSNEVDAAALINTGTINLNGNATAGTANQSTLKIAGAAGFGTAGVVTGNVNLSGDALLQFGSGGITGIAGGAQLSLNGAQSRVSIGNGTTNSALTGLTSNAGGFGLAGGATVTTAAGTDFSNSGTTNVGNANDASGDIFSVGGTLTNSGTLNVGTFFQPGLDEVDAAALVNTGTINLTGNTTAGTTSQSTLKIAGAAGFGTAGIVTGTVNLVGDALLQFGSGGITSIAGGAQLFLNGAQSRVSIGAGTTNSALTGLTSNAGNFDLASGVTVTTAAGTDFSNSGTTNVGDFNDTAGSTFSVGGTLTNSNTLDIGTSFQPGQNEVDAAALVNTGTINLNGNGGAGTTDQSTLKIAGAAGFGTAGTVTGTVNLAGDALLQFGSGGITGIAGGAQLFLNGAQSRVSIGNGTTNNALTGLTSNAGIFELASGATVTTAAGTDFSNFGTTNVGDLNDSAGSTFSVGGTLTNTNTLDIGTTFQPGLNEVDAAALVNTGTIDLTGNTTAGTANQSTLKIVGAAGFGTASAVTGTVNLEGDALLQFDSGGITSIAGGAQLFLNGAQSRVSIGNGTTNNALTGLTSNAGNFDLASGATVTTTAGTDFANTGTTNVGDFNDSAGSTFSVGGTLTNTNTLDIGTTFQSGLNEVDAAALINTGTIDLTGNTTAGTANQSTLKIAGAASFGTAGTVTGTVNLEGDALLQFDSGGITSIAGGAQLFLNGAQSRVSIGAGTTNNALTGLTSNAGNFDLANGATVTTAAGTDFSNSGTTNIGDFNDSAGSTFSIGGTLTNTNTFDIGTTFQPGQNEVDAAALVNTGIINLNGNGGAGTANQSTLKIAGAAGFGTAGTVTGSVNLAGDALLQFGSGGITSIAGGAQLFLSGAQSRVSIGAGTTNSALTGLTSNAGNFDLASGATVTTAAGTDFTNTGTTNVGGFNDSAGSKLSVGGTLTNSNTLDIGTTFQPGQNEVDAAALVNTGTINLAGNTAAGTTNQSTLKIAGAAGFGTAGTVTGTVNLAGDALLQFGSGGITSIAGGAQLSLSGAQSRVSIGAGTTNNALTGLTSNTGTFELASGATVTTAAGTDFINTGTANIGDFNDSAGSMFSVGGKLTNTGTLDIGTTFQPGQNEVDAAALVNTGTINLSGSSATNTSALTIAGATVNDGAINTDAYGRITVGSYRQDATGSLSLQIEGTAAGQFSALSVTDAVALHGGALVINDGLGFAAGETFDIATLASGKLTGVFQTLHDGGASGDGSEVAIGNGLLLGIVYNNTAGTIELEVVAAPTTTVDNFTAASGDFSTAANWDNGVPTFYSDVVIGANTSANVTLSQDATINSLALDAMGELDSTGSASLTVGSDVTVQAGATLSVATSGGAFNVAGNVTDGGTLEVGNGIVEGNFVDNGTLEIKSGTFTIAGTITGVGNIIVDAGATLVISDANVTADIVDNGTIEVTKAVTFAQNVTGSGSLAVDAGADAELAGSGPAVLAFNGVGGGIKLDAPDSVQSSSINNFQAGDTINFANAAATDVSIVNDPTLQVTTADGTKLAYNLVGSSLTGGSVAFYGNGTGGSQATGVSAPNDISGYDTGVASGTGTDFAPALGTSYFLTAGNGGGGLNVGGQLTHDGTNWTLAFPTLPNGQSVIPFSLTALNRNESSDGITVTYKLISDGGDTTRVGGSDTISNILPGGSAIDSAGNPGLGPELQVQNGNPTVYEVDSVSSSGAVLPTETLTIVVGAVGGTGGSNGGAGAGGGSGVIEIEPPGGNGGGGATGFSWGDPHLGTYDGVDYDLQQVGEFVLTKSTLAGDNFQVQIRTAPWYSSASVAVTTEVGVALGSDDVTIDLDRADTLEVNGNAVNLTAANPVDTLAGGTIRLIAPDTYEISSIHGETVDVSKYASYLSVTSVSLGANFPQGHTVGLLGTDTGNAANDFQTADGTILTQPISLTDLYGEFANSWRITDATSLLNYGAGQTTATFTDLNFPADAVSLSDIPASVLANATAAVDAAGITDPNLRADAIYDYALTNDAAFIAGGKTLQQEGQSAPLSLDPTKPPAQPGLVIQANVSNVTEPASGTTPVSFTVYSTGPVAQDTVVNYAVVSPDAGFLGAASFGGTLPTGQVTIAAGSSSATISIPVASTALGASASELLRVEVTDAAGVPVLTPTADVSVNNPAVTAGTHAIPGFAEISGGGTLTQSGNDYTLDLGQLSEGTAAALDFAVFNNALAPANQLGGVFAITGSGFTVTGTGPFSGLAAGGLQAGIDFAADTSSLGAHSETLTLHPTESNPSGFSGILSDITLTITDMVAPCYCPGTLILTDRGEKPVEELAIGDKVNTMSGAVRPIKWIGRRSYSGRFALGQKDILPVCLKAGCLDEGVPRRDLWISPHHAMYLEGVLIEAKDLVNGVSIVQAERVDQVEYIHIELDSHDVIFAEGSLSESFVDDDSRGMFHNAHEYPALYADAKRAPARYYAPRVQDGYEVEAARVKIEQRAGLRKTAGARPSGVRGFVDAVSSRGITGWAQNVDHSEAPVCLDIYANGRLIGQTLANQYRQDLLQAGLGSGRHGFAFTPPKGFNFASHAIEVRRSFDGAVLQRFHRAFSSQRVA